MCVRAGVDGYVCVLVNVYTFVKFFSFRKMLIMYSHSNGTHLKNKTGLKNSELQGSASI